MKKALTIGVIRQHGSYFPELLLEKGYKAQGIKTRFYSFKPQLNNHLNIDLHKVNIKIVNTFVQVNHEYYRPTKVDLLICDSTKSKTQLNWKPKYNLPALVKDMMGSDLKLA